MKYKKRTTKRRKTMRSRRKYSSKKNKVINSQRIFKHRLTAVIGCALQNEPGQFKIGFAWQ